MKISERDHSTPLVSVVITCFNQGRFLRESIGSVLRQTYREIEIVVIDDGSWDNTREIALQFKGIKYVHQPNAGLSAARNKGIVESGGQFLVFLDADDWLYPAAVETNLRYCMNSPAYAFVSGGHDKVDEWNYPLEQEQSPPVETDHYLHLLRGNYIGMHAAVMYRRWVFDTFRFDTTLPACEDYDLYLRITRIYPVHHHPVKIAAYRIHSTNMSRKIPFMLTNVITVCKRQRPKLKNRRERQAYDQGLRIWKEYYATKLYCSLFTNPTGSAPRLAEVMLLMKHAPGKLIRLIVKKTQNVLLTHAKKNLPDKVLKSLFTSGLVKNYTPQPGKVNAGDFQRVTPFSVDFGFDRGGPVDRFYIETFLETNKNCVTGTVLEIGDNAYTMRFGGNRVTRSDVLHIDSRNEKATYIGDITHVPEIPSGFFDCIIFTQTLHLIYDFKSAVKTCHRILKPGGCLLLTVPGISQVDYGEWKDYWLWSFTANSIRKLLMETFREENTDVRSYGNVYVAAAFLYGMGLPEVKKDFLTYHDPAYQVIISAKAVKT